MPLGDWGFKTRLMDWKLLRAREIGLAVLNADQGMNGIRAIPVVDMIEDIADLLIPIIGEIVLTYIDLANTPRRHRYIQGRIRSFQQLI